MPMIEVKLYDHACDRRIRAEEIEALTDALTSRARGEGAHPRRHPGRPAEATAHRGQTRGVAPCR